MLGPPDVHAAGELPRSRYGRPHCATWKLRSSRSPLRWAFAPVLTPSRSARPAAVITPAAEEPGAWPASQSLPVLQAVPYTQGVATPAHNELHHLVDQLPPDQARRLLRLVETDPELADYIPETLKPGERPHDQVGPVPIGEARRRISFAGILDDGPADLAEHAEDYLREHFTRPV